jgi:hypothetical protein
MQASQGTCRPGYHSTGIAGPVSGAREREPVEPSTKKPMDNSGAPIGSLVHKKHESQPQMGWLRSQPEERRLPIWISPAPYCRANENVDWAEASHSLLNTSPSAIAALNPASVCAAWAVCSRWNAIKAARTTAVVLSKRPLSTLLRTKSSKSGGNATNRSGMGRLHLHIRTRFAPKVVLTITLLQQKRTRLATSRGNQAN